MMWSAAKALMGVLPDGVRLFDSKPLTAFCRCSQDRIGALLSQFPPEEQADMADEHGLIHVDCQFCSTKFPVPVSAIVS